MLLSNTTIEELEETIRFQLQTNKEILNAECGINEEDRNFIEGKIYAYRYLLLVFFNLEK